MNKEATTNFCNSLKQALLEVISTLQFDLVEALWQSFYKSPAAANKADNGTLDNNEFNFTKEELVTFCNYKPVQVSLLLIITFEMNNFFIFIS